MSPQRHRHWHQHQRHNWFHHELLIYYDHCLHQVWHASTVESDGEFWKEFEHRLHRSRPSTRWTRLPSWSLWCLTLVFFANWYSQGSQVMEKILILCCAVIIVRNIFSLAQRYFGHLQFLFCFEQRRLRLEMVALVQRNCHFHWQARDQHCRWPLFSEVIVESVLS